MQVKAVNVIILLYDLTVIEARNRIEEFWLPEISAINEIIPIIIVGNKKDLPDAQDEPKEYIENIVRKFPQVEATIELSTKLHKDLSDLLYCAQRAILYPIYPLYNQSTKELKPKYISALVRIFRMCDLDNDQYLNDKELKNLQEKAFMMGVSDDEIKSIKELLIEEVNFYIRVIV